MDDSAYLPAYASGAGGTLPLPAVAGNSLNLSAIGHSQPAAATHDTLRVLMATKERELREVSEYRGAMLEAALAEKVR